MSFKECLAIAAGLSLVVGGFLLYSFLWYRQLRIFGQLLADTYDAPLYSRISPRQWQWLQEHHPDVAAVFLRHGITRVKVASQSSLRTLLTWADDIPADDAACLDRGRQEAGAEVFVKVLDRPNPWSDA